MFLMKIFIKIKKKKIYNETKLKMLRRIFFSISHKNMYFIIRIYKVVKFSGVLYNNKNETITVTLLSNT